MAISSFQDLFNINSNPRTYTNHFGVQVSLPEGFNANDYLKANPDVKKYERGPLQHYLDYGYNENRKLKLDATAKPGKDDTGGNDDSGNDTNTGGNDTPAISANAQVVPGDADPKNPGEINVVDYAGQVATDPSKFLNVDDPDSGNINEDMNLSNRTPDINEDATGTNIDKNDYQNPGSVSADTAQASTSTVNQTAVANQVDPRNAVGYNPVNSLPNMEQNGQMQAAQGSVDQQALINEDNVTLDTNAIANGETGTGQALNDFANLDLNDIDPKATVQGQLEELQSQFVDSNGNPKIPVWAQGVARDISKIAAFSGMTGTAATMAMSQALMEASISIATKDAQFYQTVTLQNLNNEQAQTINKANVLANMDLANADARLAAAIQNSKAFMDMDLANLSNEQQANLINQQARQQAILEDSKQENASRLFLADNQNDLNKFYDQLQSQISQFNATAQNNMKQYNASQKNEQNRFNVSEKNDIAKFNADMENQREQFYKNMQFNIDTANAKWRQTVTLTEAQNSFDAAAMDVKNMVGVGIEELNQIWDRSDSLLDYLWKSSENEEDRNLQLTLGHMKAEIEDDKGKGSLIGSVVGAASSSFFDWLF